MAERGTVGEVLMQLLARRGVDMVFGIPGVHTVEFYRGLGPSGVRHITPRHEQSAAFMADGYARATGRPGVCLLITGPGVTNAITAMAQARADSVPMLVISGVNRATTFGHEEGFLHELPDQGAMMRSVALYSHTLHAGADLERVLDRAFAAMTSGRPGPVHIEIPLDVMGEVIDLPEPRSAVPSQRLPDARRVATAAERLRAAQRPLILAGGGAVGAAEPLLALAERLDAPVVTTTNARGIAAGHLLCVPASPSLVAVRALMSEADVVLAVGTQFGRTDYDMYEDGNSPDLAELIRIECDPLQMTRGRLPDLPLLSDARLTVKALLDAVGAEQSAASGADRAARTRTAAQESLTDAYRAHIDVIHRIQNAVPGCRIVGDSTQLIYAGNMYAEIAAPRCWFNAATGYGALGYGAPAAVGAALGDPDRPVVCLTGDGGLQFCLAELGAALDERTPVIFVVWNNNGYGEIEQYMLDNAIPPEGVRPSAPDFVQIAAAYGMGAEAITGTTELEAALERAQASGAARLIEIRV